MGAHVAEFRGIASRVHVRNFHLFAKEVEAIQLLTIQGDNESLLVGGEELSDERKQERPNVGVESIINSVIVHCTCFLVEVLERVLSPRFEMGLVECFLHNLNFFRFTYVERDSQNKNFFGNVNAESAVIILSILGELKKPNCRLPKRKRPRTRFYPTSGRKKFC